MKKIKLRYIFAFIFMCVFLCTGLNNNAKAVEVKDNAITKIATSTTNKVKDPDASNTLLKSLKVEGYEIFPEFNKYTTTYYVKIPTDVRSLEINAEAESENATVKVRGDSNFYNTENTVSITVTSKDRSYRKYKVIATRQDDNDLKLTSLSIDKATLSPAFSEDQHNYKTSMEIIKIDSIPPLEIKATANSETAKIEILGNKDLTEGENLITILLKDKDENDEEISSIYQINVTISTKTMVTTFEDTEIDWVEKVKELYYIAKGKVIEWFSDENRAIATYTAGGAVILVLMIMIISSKIRKHSVEKKKEQIKRRAK